MKNLKKVLSFLLLAFVVVSCSSEPKEADGNDRQPVPAEIPAPKGPVIKSKTIAEGVMVGIRGNELQLDAKTSIQLPEPGNDSVNVIFVLRPAETLGTKTSLSPHGQIRASMLARNFARSGINRIYCEGNAAMQTGLMTSRENACDLGLVKDKKNDELAKTIMKSFKGERIMVVGSPSMMTDFVNQFAGSDKYAVSSEDYDQLYVIIAKDLGDAEIHHLRY